MDSSFITDKEQRFKPNCMFGKPNVENGKCRYSCERCGKEISKDEYEEFDGFCEECYWAEEDELTEEEGII